MNKYERRAEQQRKPAMRSSMTMATASVCLLVVVLLIIRLNSSASPAFFFRAGIGLAILLLILRQISRRPKGKAPRAAQPDPRSTLKLN